MIQEQELSKDDTIVEYSKVEAVLAILKDKYAGKTFDCNVPAQMDAAKAARDDVRKYRTGLEKLRKDLKEPALRRCQMIDSEARRITAALEAIEKPIQEQIDEVAKREQREAAERARLEAEQKAAEEKAAREAEERRLAEERARLDAERKAFEEEQRAAREKIEAEECAAREQREAEEAVRREELRKEEEARRAAEEAERKARAEIEAEERRLREEREAVEREKRRIAQEGLDADAALVSFKSRFGHLPQYAEVVKAIDALGLEE